MSAPPDPQDPQDPQAGPVPFAGVRSAAWPVQRALVRALLAHAPLAALLAPGPDGAPAVLDGQAPPAQPLAYVTIGDTPEGDASTYGRPGHAGAITLHVWAPDKAAAAAIHDAISDAVDGVPLPVDGHTPARGRVTLAASLADPDGATHHRVLRYAAATRALRRA